MTFALRFSFSETIDELPLPEIAVYLTRYLLQPSPTPNV
jgi:hypothetical protein